MKVYKSKYRNHWISPYQILTAVCFWERDKDRIYNLTDDPNNPYEPWVKALDPVCGAVKTVLDFVHPRINYVRIDKEDTWSMHHTLADIILPMLKQLRETKHGAPWTDDEDVPKGMNLRSTEAEPKENEWDTDSNHFKRWDWILDEMIWAFEQQADETSEDKFFDHSEVDHTKKPWDSEEYKNVKWDQEAHQKWQERKSNGFRLFGRYYENLWD